MKKSLLMMACLGICAFVLTSCAKDSGFSAGTEMSGEELEKYRGQLLAAQDADKEPAASEKEDVPTISDQEKEEAELSVVYYTENGTVWHAERDCSYLKRSQNVLEGSVEGAAIAGKTRPCSSCAKAYKEE